MKSSATRISDHMARLPDDRRAAMKPVPLENTVDMAKPARAQKQ